MGNVVNALQIIGERWNALQCIQNALKCILTQISLSPVFPKMVTFYVGPCYQFRFSALLKT